MFGYSVRMTYSKKLKVKDRKYLKHIQNNCSMGAEVGLTLGTKHPNHIKAQL